MNSHRRSVSIAPAADRAAPLSKGQKTFNDLVERIGKQRARLLAWETAIPQYQQKYLTDLLPELTLLGDLQVQLVHALDRASCEQGLGKGDRRIIDALIVDLAGPLLLERDDAELKAVFNRHSESDFDQQKALAAEDMKSMLEDVFGIESGSLDDVLEAADAEVTEKSRQRDVEKEARAASRQKRKSPKQRALEAQREGEAELVSLSIREVYRKLASALHPDRETDPEERGRKTLLMQRVNAAYAQKNLLQLLELQLELEHIDQSAINNLSEDRLRYYNKILKDQLAELAQEIERIELDFKARFDLPPFEQVSPKSIARDLALDIAGVERSIRQLKSDVRACGNVTTLKPLLARWRRERKAAEFDNLPF